MGAMVLLVKKEALEYLSPLTEPPCPFQVGPSEGLTHSPTLWAHCYLQSLHRQEEGGTGLWAAAAATLLGKL